MSVEQERDARLFLEDVFGSDPVGLITISIAPKWGSPHCVKTPADALHYVVDRRDVYFRLGLVAHRPAKRGEEADTIAIPGVWAEIDVNGGPTGNGDLVTDGAPTIKAAMEIAHSVLEPTVMVQSGYGLHAYWLFQQPWRFETDEERARAKRLVQGWQARLRQEAKQVGVTKLDSTHDLARVFRVPGSMNGKADAPAPVRLLDNGGPRYTIEQIDAETVEPEPEPVPTSPSGVSGGTAAEILDRHADLATIASRKGTKPGDGSASAWDFMLGCRAAEHGYDDSTLTALIRHARRTHKDDKGERDDYLEKTVAAVRRRVGYVTSDASADEVLAELTKLLRVGEIGRRVTETHVAGHGNSASASIVLDDGYTIEFASFAHVAQPGTLGDQLATTVAIATDFSKLQARRVASLVRKAASRNEELREHEVYTDEAAKLLRLAQTVDFDFADQAQKWARWADLDAMDPEDAPEERHGESTAERRARESRAAETYARRMVVLHDVTTGVRFVHAGWLQQFMRLRLGASATPQRARQAILRAGWTVRGRDGRMKATDPQDGRVLILTFYLVPKGWEARKGPGEDR